MKLKSLLFIMSLMLAVGATFSSCSKDDDDKDNKGDDTGTIIGVWSTGKNYYEYEYDAKARMPHKIHKMKGSGYYEAFYVFTESYGCANIYIEYDSKGKNIIYVRYWTGVYSYTDNKVLINWVDALPEEIPYRIDKNKLIFTFTDYETGEEWDDEYIRKNESYLKKNLGEYTIENYITSRVWMSEDGWEPMYDDYNNNIGEKGTFMIYKKNGTSVLLEVYKDEYGNFKAASRDPGTWTVEDYLLKEEFVAHPHKDSWISFSYDGMELSKGFFVSNYIEWERWYQAGEEYDPEYLEKAGVGVKKR